MRDEIWIPRLGLAFLSAFAIAGLLIQRESSVAPSASAAVAQGVLKTSDVVALVAGFGGAIALLFARQTAVEARRRDEATQRDAAMADATVVAAQLAAMLNFMFALWKAVARAVAARGTGNAPLGKGQATNWRKTAAEI